jgi:hypothetical protein
LPSQVQHDRDGLVEHDLAIDEYGQLAGRVQAQELWPTMLASLQIDDDGLEVDPELLERPARADRPGGCELIQFHVYGLLGPDPARTHEQALIRQSTAAELIRRKRA